MYVQFLKCRAIKIPDVLYFCGQEINNDIPITHVVNFSSYWFLNQNIVYVCYNWRVQRKAFCSQLLLCFSAFLSLTIFLFDQQSLLYLEETMSIL